MLARYTRWWKTVSTGCRLQRRSWGLLVLVGVWLGPGALVHAQQLQHASEAGGLEREEGRGIAVDADGASYVTGSFSGSATFGAGETRETILTSAGAEDIFVAKYDSAGRLVWATQAGGANADFNGGIATDSQGNTYVTGGFSDAATFGAGEAQETILTGVGVRELFVAKYDNAGRLVWARQAGGRNFHFSGGIAVDADGNSYVTGDFFGSVTFGAGEAGETTLTSTGDADVFVAKYDPDGRLVRVVQAEGLGFAGGFGIALDSIGNSYVTGAFTGTATFGAGEARETTLTSAGDRKLFVAKYDPEGRFIWATQARGLGIDEGFGIVLDSTGNSYVTGTFVGISTFGAGETRETMLDSATSELFVAKYDLDGHLVWATQARSQFVRNGNIAVDSDGNSRVAGTFVGEATFGAGEAREATLVSEDGDLFVAQYDAEGRLVGVVQAGGAGAEQGQSIAVDKVGRSHVTGSFEGDATFGVGQRQKVTLISAGQTDMFVAVFADAADPCLTAQPTQGCTVNGKPQQLCVGDPSRAANTIIGTSGSDVIIGTSGKDTIKGLGGDDLLCGAGGNDSLNGGDGDDVLIGSEGNDILAGGRGQDTLDGSAGNDKLNGGLDADTCMGGESAKNCEFRG